MIDIKELRRMAQAATPGPWQFWHGWVATKIDKDGGVVIVERPTPSGGKYQARVDANFKFIAAANPATISELLDRLEAAESECLEESRLNGMGAERELALMAKLEAAEKTNREWLRANAPGGWIDNLRIENEALRAKIAEMERQEPVMWANSSNINSSRINKERGGRGDQHTCSETQTTYHDTRLYALPGAQPAPSVPDTYAAGINAVAAMLQSKADEYAKEHGHDDMGGLSFGPGMGGEIKMDYYTNLIELVDDVRAMLADAPSVPNDVVEQAVNRFLSWKLPKDFHPDGGMVFIPTKGRGYDSPHWPAGTNLLNAQQAREMLRYVLNAAPEAKP